MKWIHDLSIPAVIGGAYWIGSAGLQAKVGSPDWCIVPATLVIFGGLFLFIAKGSYGREG